MSTISFFFFTSSAQLSVACLKPSPVCQLISLFFFPAHPNSDWANCSYSQKSHMNRFSQRRATDQSTVEEVEV